jgi:hypothetical protein
MTQLWEINSIDIGPHMIYDHSRLEDCHGDFQKDAIEGLDSADWKRCR